MSRGFIDEGAPRLLADTPEGCISPSATIKRLRMEASLDPKRRASHTSFQVGGQVSSSHPVSGQSASGNRGILATHPAIKILHRMPHCQTQIRSADRKPRRHIFYVNRMLGQKTLRQRLSLAGNHRRLNVPAEVPALEYTSSTPFKAASFAPKSERSAMLCTMDAANSDWNLRSKFPGRTPLARLYSRWGSAAPRARHHRGSHP